MKGPFWVTAGWVCTQHKVSPHIGFFGHFWISCELGGGVTPKMLRVEQLTQQWRVKPWSADFDPATWTTDHSWQTDTDNSNSCICAEMKCWSVDWTALWSAVGEEGSSVCLLLLLLLPQPPCSLSQITHWHTDPEPAAHCWNIQSFTETTDWGPTVWDAHSMSLSLETGRQTCSHTVSSSYITFKINLCI